MTKTDADLIAEFLATKGATQIPEGARAYEDRAMYTAAREGGKARAIADAEDAEAESRWHTLHDTATEARLNGHSVTGYDSAGNVYTKSGRY